MPIEFDDPFAYSSFDECLSACQLPDAQACLMLCDPFLEDEEEVDDP